MSTLVLSHIVIGLVILAINVGMPSIEWPEWVALLFGGWIGSQIVLIGAWGGFTNVAWRVRLKGLVVGLLWMIALAVLADVPSSLDFAWPVVLGIPLVLVVAACLVCRYVFANVELSGETDGAEAQFTLTGLISLITIVGALLSLGRLVQQVTHEFNLAVAGCVFALVGVLCSGVVLWAGLGRGSVSIRASVGLLGGGLLGLIFPYYFDRPAAEYWQGPLLGFSGAACSLLSLLVVRRCGYRFVRIRRGDKSLKEAANGPCEA